MDIFQKGHLMHQPIAMGYFESGTTLATVAGMVLCWTRSSSGEGARIGPCANAAFERISEEMPSKPVGGCRNEHNSKEVEMVCVANLRLRLS